MTSPTHPADDLSPISTPSAVSPPPPLLPPHRSHSPTTNLKSTDPFQFGSRYLLENDDVYEFNAWDHVSTSPDYDAYAEVQYAKQRETPVSEFDRRRFNDNPAKWWDLFYKNNKDSFFKDRKWLKQEFPVLAAVTSKEAGGKVVLEVGAGAGNTAFPLVRGNENAELRVHAVDFSGRAVQVMRADEECGKGKGVLRADVWDVTSEGLDGGDGELPPGLAEGSVDVVVMVFVFSALAPGQWDRAVRNVYRVLKPGGEVLFRDYGRGDLAQVRFKKGRWLEENFYVRGDGTRVYFFEEGELRDIWGKVGKSVEGGKDDDEGRRSQDAERESGGGGGFEIVDLGVDRRLLVNRQRKLKMYRCWMQGRFRKRIRDHQVATDELKPPHDGSP